jgi:peptidoglycan/xylan/chitin deacetylase (PgdA/CDA1 family)
MYAGLKRLNYRLAGWSWGLWDWNWWRPREAADLARRLSRRASPGDIIVMHDGHHVNPRADRRYAVEAASLMVPALRARGFAFGTLCEK